MIVSFTAKAKIDLAEIGDYIGSRNPCRAITFVEDLHEHCVSLADRPRAHPLVPRFEAQSLRRSVHGGYLIFYRVREELVEVIRVLHSSRDYENILLGGGSDL